ncbi:MAG: HEAT repeat domain-containing protein [Bacteroidota bacterium]
MKKEEFEIVAFDYLRKTLSEKEQKDFEAFLDKHVDFKMELHGLKEAWELMDKPAVPETSEQMDNTFFNMLSAEVEAQGKSNHSVQYYLDNIFHWLFKPQLAYGLLFAVLAAVYFWPTPNNRRDSLDTIKVADSETEQVREKLVLTLLEQPSANKRLEGVSEANKIGKVDDQVINALLKTLNKDLNVNVRLAAIESLTNYVEHPKVRQGLIQSIPNQESPIIQVTLANLMLALEEKKSIEPFKQLLEKPELDTTVKKKIEKTIKSII